MGPGQGDPAKKTYPVEAGSRLTVFVPGDAGREKDVSVRLSSASPFLAERPMYFNYRYKDLNTKGGDCVIGATTPATEWFLAEGYTGPSFDEWICIQNPGDAASTVEVIDNADGGYQLSTRLMVTSGPGVIVERPMYFICNGWDGGHTAVGFK
jgi:hypothetical protein